MKQAVTNQIKGLDRYPASPDTYWAGIKGKQTFIGGIIGILFIIVTLVLVVFKSISVINKYQVNLDSFVRRDMGPVTIEEEQIILVMLYVDFEQQIIQILDPDQLPQFGVTAYMVQYDIENVPTKQLQKVNITTVEMERCTGKNNDQFLCAHGLKYEPECGMDAMDNQVCHHTKQYHLLIMDCDEDVHPDCSPVVSKHLMPTLILFDTKFNVYELNNSNIFRRGPIFVNSFNGGALIDPNQKYVFQVPISKLVIQLEQSILPRSLPFFQNNNSTEKYFYPTQEIKLDPFYQQIYPAYMEFYIHRSPYTERYRRYYPRFDTMLGQVFGLMGLISLFLAFFCAGYNQWLMDKHIKQSLNTEKQEHQSDSYIQYIKEKAQGITNVCKSKKRDQSLLESEDLAEENSHKDETVIDIVQIYKQMQKLKAENIKKQQALKQMRSKMSKLNEKVQILQQRDKDYEIQTKSIKEQ